MRKVQIAEWILGLVTSRDRAASTVGDLLEQAAARGVLWFWSGALRTAASLLWRGVAENPVRITAVAFIGLAVDITASLLLAGVTGLVFFVMPVSAVSSALGAWSGHQVHPSYAWWIAPQLAISVLIGRMLARWAPGRELSACLAFGILGSIFSLCADVISPGGFGFSTLFWVFLSDVSQRTPVLAGAVWGRHRRLAPH
jgi:hypothetical protein